MKSAHRLCAVIATAALLGACSSGKQSAPAATPIDVTIVTAAAQSVPLSRQTVGRLSALRSADVRARVAGILEQRVYDEGSDVKQGQVLFRIDPAPLRATLNAQLANLAAAQATLDNNRIAAERARSVAAKGLLSRANLDTAEAAERTAAAAVKQAQANVETARINLGYAEVAAPISGRAGKQQVTEGALVGQGSATLLTTVEQVDPLYVNFSLAVGELEAMRRAAASGQVSLSERNQVQLRISLPDGTPYAESGLLDFTDASVDAATGAVTLRGSVPNPQHSLMPGMFVNVDLELGAIKQAWLVSQSAVQRDAQGLYVFVAANGKAAIKHIKAETAQAGNWIVTEGLADGDQIVMSNLQKLRADTAVKTSPWQPTAGTAPGSVSAH
ncbi:MAG: efflux RND transporter periplasmic adaptor subunit [Dokdonella sp.]|uniref:efflux RND transporter periplasmic adaptor subunit n=1 Tax=Dokdonella sp. TaxID=2291710 RepID=UPI0025BD7B31|nr:efflux RND transporter periplasmic adaptor subunit [Dokdonella sp.]MBZ0222567.1 efflux RND transporter periplasmic adaptor subunit [Dokdonella sp.]MCC7256344.1 efflux RND transporter periplasmic adaptor subunit [Dokdonella sp.]